MVFALHGPDAITFLSESLAGVGAHSGIDEEGNVVDVIDKGTYVVVIVTFFVVSALGSQEDVVAPQAEHFGLGIPDGKAFQVGMVGRGLSYQRNDAQGLERAVNVGTAGRIVQRMFLTQAGCEGFEAFTADGLTIAIDHGRRTVAASRGIGKVHLPSLAYIDMCHVFAHEFHLLIAPKVHPTASNAGEQTQIIEQLTARYVPVGRSFFASTIGLHVVQELVDRLHGAINGPCQAVGVVFQQHEAKQSVGVAPRIPVVDARSGLGLHGHPPKLALQVGCEQAPIEFRGQTAADAGVDFIQGRTQEVVDPRQHLCRTASPQVQEGLRFVRQRGARQVSRQAPLRHFAEEEDTVGDIPHKTSLTLGELGHEQCCQGMGIGRVGVLHHPPVARIHKLQIVGSPDHLPSIVEIGFTLLDQPVAALAGQLVPACTVGIGRIGHPATIHHQALL